MNKLKISIVLFLIGIPLFLAAKQSVGLSREKATLDTLSAQLDVLIAEVKNNNTHSVQTLIPKVLGAFGSYTNPVCQTGIGTTSFVYLSSSLASSTVSCKSDGFDRTQLSGFIRSTTTPNTLLYEVQYSVNNVDWFNLRREQNDITLKSTSQGDPNGTSTIWMASTSPLFAIPILSDATSTFTVELPNVASVYTRVRFNIKNGDAAFWTQRIEKQLAPR